MFKQITLQTVEHQEIWTAAEPTHGVVEPKEPRFAQILSLGSFELGFDGRRA